MARMVDIDGPFPQIGLGASQPIEVYQIVGESGSDLLFVPTSTFPIELLSDEPTVAGHLRRLASFSRLMTTDLLGMGSSDETELARYVETYENRSGTGTLINLMAPSWRGDEAKRR